MSTSRRAYKRPRFSPAQWRNFYRDRGLPKEILGFEDEKLKPVARTTLDVDPRFFPSGIRPGTILEIKGPEKSGKTFMLMYIIARVLNVYQDKKVVFLDTRHKFSVRNLLSIIWHFDKDMQKSISKECLEKSLPNLLKTSKKISAYLRRVIVLPSYSPENLMLTLGPSRESQLARMLLLHKDICLVAVDCIDDYSFAETLGECPWAPKWPNIMDLLKESVVETRCPVISTTLVMAFARNYYRKMPRIVNQVNLVPPSQANRQGTSKGEDDCQELLHNFGVDHSGFTEILEIKPDSNAELKKLAQLLKKRGRQITHSATAYLRSRHSAKTAGSGENHPVRFSIFSDMLWVAD